MTAPDTAALVPGARVVGPVAVAVGAEALAWLLAAWPGTLSPAWYGVPRLLAAVHLLTLGTLALSITGFGWQLVPVVTAAPPPRGWSALARGVNLTLMVGVGTLCAGFLVPVPGGLAAVGGTAVGAALLVRAGAVAWAVGTAQGRPDVRAWLLSAEVCLLLGLGVGGLLLAGRMGHPVPVLGSPIQGIGWHVALLLFGWVGGWIGGLSTVLLPMFTVSPVPHRAAVTLAGLLWFGGLALGSVGGWLLGAAVLVGALLWSLSRRVARHAPIGLVAVVPGLLALLAVGALARTVDRVTLVAVGLVLFALPVLRGVALRIGPFLVWSHHLAPHIQRAPPVRSLVPAGPARLAAALSVVGGLGVVAGLGTDHFRLAQAGAALALAGTLCHAATLATAVGRAVLARHHLDALPGTEHP